jgi:hypothetical protein
MPSRGPRAIPKRGKRHDGAMKWLLRLVFLRILGPRAVPILALLGLIQAVRGMRNKDVESVDPRTGRVRLKSGRGR